MQIKDPFFKAYVICALWSETDDKGIPLDRNYAIKDISPATLHKMEEDCANFQKANKRDLHLSGLSKSNQGHNFWLSRNGHGSGYFDSASENSQSVLDRLQEAAKLCGPFSLIVDDFKKLSHV